MLLVSTIALFSFYQNYQLTQDYNRLVVEQNAISRDSVPYKSYVWALQNPRVVALGSLAIDDYNISFEPVCASGSARQECLAWTSEQKDIHIVTNRTVDVQIESCVHEQLHNLIVMDNATEEERIVEDLDREVSTPVCDALNVTLQSRI